MDARTVAPERPAPLLLSVEQALDHLGGDVSRSKFYEYLRNGSLRSVSMGRRRLIRRSDLERFVEDLQPVA